MNAVFDAAQYVDGSDANYTWVTYRAGEARDLPVMLHGNVATPGEVTPRHFLSVLSKGDGVFRQGSGRLELAEKIFTDAAPLAARVIVNRVWDWHFGGALVGTTSDFGTQGDKPTHPALAQSGFVRVRQNRFYRLYQRKKYLPGELESREAFIRYYGVDSIGAEPTASKKKKKKRQPTTIASGDAR